MTVIVDITQLNGGVNGTVQGSDVYPAVDVTDTTQAPTGTTKRYTIQLLQNFILTSIGLTTYAPCVTCSTVNLNATYSNGISGVGATLTNAGVQTPFTLNGQSGVLNARYLIKDQTSQAQNGIYTLTTVGTGSINWVLTRSTDFNSVSNIVNGGVVFVTTGSINANTLWQVTYSGSLVVGTTLLSWAKFAFSSAGGGGGLTWNVIAGATQQIVNDNGYVPKNAGLTTFTLPLTASVGQRFEIRGYPGGGGWLVAQNAGQTMYVANSPSTTGVLGSVSSFLSTDGIQGTCIDDNNIWALLPIGNLTIV